MHTLFLFDVDGVLVQPKGYKLALRDTINRFARQYGFSPVNVSMEEIALFEACGLTNEWDSAAMCVGAMLVAQQLGSTLRPDFAGIAREIKNRNPDELPVAPISHAVLCEQHGRDNHELDTLFNDIFDVNTPTTRVQQVHTLGHERFLQTYGMVAPFESESYLLVHDTPLLSTENREYLLQWREADNHGFTIYTARPSKAPTDDGLGYAPEAELARELLGFDDTVPLIAGGRVQWLARQHGKGAGDYIKPSPVQALAGIGAAFGNEELPALHAAAALVENNALIAPFDALVKHPLRIYVFEDSTGGIQAVRGAVELLQEHRAQVEFVPIGISDEQSKQQALKTVTAQVFDNINIALGSILTD